MGELTITIDLNTGKTSYSPGEQLQGRVTITSPDGPWEADAIDLIVFWRTSGIGTRDEGIAHTVNLCKKDENIPSHFSREFNLPLPIQPYTYAGQLVKISWHVGVYVKKGWLKNQETELEITLQPASHSNPILHDTQNTIFYDNEGNPLPGEPLM